MATRVFEVIVIGGGAVGLAAAYEVAKGGASVMILEQNNFYNQAGSSGDLARMFRTMYSEDFMADLAKEAMGHWEDLEKDSGTPLRLMSGLLNYGDPAWTDGSPEGTLLGPIENLNRLDMSYKIVDAKAIEARYPFKNLPSDWMGIYAPDNGVIDVQLLLRTLLRLAMAYGAEAKQHTCVGRIRPSKEDNGIWEVDALLHKTNDISFRGKKIVIAPGAYVNHVLEPSFGFSLKLDIWEMVSNYFSCDAGPGGVNFPSMWFQFAPDKGGRSQLFYGFPTLPWAPPNLVRVAVDAATNRITDPFQRTGNVFNPDDIRDTQEFIKEHMVGVDSTVPAFTTSCLQTNVCDNMFVLDYVPKEYLHGGPENSVVVFTAGWAMKFVPLLGKALADMALHEGSKYALKEFSITRPNIIVGPSIPRQIYLAPPSKDQDLPLGERKGLRRGSASGKKKNPASCNSSKRTTTDSDEE